MNDTYTAYNLTFRSELSLPELIPLHGRDGENDPGQAPPDVCIRLGVVPEHLPDPTGKGVLYQASANQFLLNMDAIARYLVQNGDEIIIEPIPDALDSDIRVFLLGSCFGALLHQRGLLVLHASAIYTERGAVLFTGPSGIGKSTLLGEMLNRGYAMIVDDVCAVVLDEDGRAMTLSGYPRTRLWADAARKLAVETGRLDRTRPGLEKFERQIPEQFWPQPAPLRHIYHLALNDEDAIRLEPLPRIQTFGAVLHNTYRQVFLDGLEMRQSHFDLVSGVASAVGVTRVLRPCGGFKLKELADRIEEDLQAGAQASAAERK